MAGLTAPGLQRLTETGLVSLAACQDMNTNTFVIKEADIMLLIDLLLAILGGIPLGACPHSGG
jgi:hypothetical protein